MTDDGNGEIPDFLTVKEAAALLRVHTRTIENRIRSRQLPAKKLTGGRILLIDRHDVLAQLQDAHPEDMEDKHDRTTEQPKSAHCSEAV